MSHSRVGIAAVGRCYRLSCDPDDSYLAALSQSLRRRSANKALQWPQWRDAAKGQTGVSDPTPKSAKPANTDQESAERHTGWIIRPFGAYR